MEQELQCETTVHTSFLFDDLHSVDIMEIENNSADLKLFFENMANCHFH
jgi:hypothetical protein